jgi:hypothetical protein
MLAQRDSLDKEEWQRVREEFRNEKNDESVDESFMQIANGPNAGWKHGAWWKIRRTMRRTQRYVKL